MNGRTLEVQVSEDKSRRLRWIIAGFEALRIRGRVSSYYIMEICRCIDRGMLLAATELSTTLLEIWLRDLLVVRLATMNLKINKEQYKLQLLKIDRELEGIRRRGQNSHKIIKQLYDLKVITDTEVEWLLTFFENIRNPLHHGLSGKLLASGTEIDDLIEDAISKEEILIARVFGHEPDSRLHGFEDYLDKNAVVFLEQVLNFLANHHLSETT